MEAPLFPTFSFIFYILERVNEIVKIHVHYFRKRFIVIWYNDIVQRELALAYAIINLYLTKVLEN